MMTFFTHSFTHFKSVSFSLFILVFFFFSVAMLFFAIFEKRWCTGFCSFVPCMFYFNSLLLILKWASKMMSLECSSFFRFFFFFPSSFRVSMIWNGNSTEIETETYTHSTLQMTYTFFFCIYLLSVLFINVIYKIVSTSFYFSLLIFCFTLNRHIQQRAFIMTDIFRAW